jgi:hypothetical protein
MLLEGSTQARGQFQAGIDQRRINNHRANRLRHRAGGLDGSSNFVSKTGFVQPKDENTLIGCVLSYH